MKVRTVIAIAGWLHLMALVSQAQPSETSAVMTVRAEVVPVASIVLNPPAAVRLDPREDNGTAELEVSTSARAAFSLLMPEGGQFSFSMKDSGMVKMDGSHHPVESAWTVHHPSKERRESDLKMTLKNYNGDHAGRIGNWNTTAVIEYH